MSNLTVQAPLEEPARQEYFMEMAKKQVAQLSRELGRPLTLLHQHQPPLF